jgi:glycosyltransferase involved in cell wall biosynthesis
MTCTGTDIWLDVTRLVSRVGRGPFTGIDRVEHAYLAGLLGRDVILSGFARTAAGYVLLDRDGLTALLERIDGRVAWGASDMTARLSRRLSPARKRAEADLRRLARATCLHLGLERLLRRFLRPATWLLNVGHSNLTHAVLRAFRNAGARIAVMVHDTIPLDLPDLHRPGMAASFAARMAAVAAHADLMLTPSEASSARIRHHLPGCADLLVVRPGVSLATPDRGALAERLVPIAPYFVSVGTIDPRKNQMLLLDVWDRLGPDRPALYLAGSRGWCSSGLAHRLHAPPDGVTELPGLRDDAVAALVEASAGLLHPSLAEGFGFPPLEAALMGVPVALTELAVYRETLGDIGVYLPKNDLYQWKRTVEALAKDHRPGEQTETRRPDRPTWDAHLNLVLSKL